MAGPGPAQAVVVKGGVGGRGLAGGSGRGERDSGGGGGRVKRGWKG